ncbi:uncharacterized protein [Venturia canescens]|uniref:uncharacterized protein n=1 Tax=Venturia canescens TaxID=32260 RepID=UPI001C9BD366|nr:uncharacterized protein LOC122410754 [Venturia canescens]
MNRHALSLALLMLAATSGSNGKDDARPRSFGDLLKNCSPKSSKESAEGKDFVDILRNCMQRRALIAMDALLADDIIPVIEGIDLVRFKKNSNQSIDSQQSEKQDSAGGREGGQSWGSIVLGRLARIFRTHVLKIDVDQLSYLAFNRTNSVDNADSNVVQGRRRRHRRRHHMMPMLMMGLLIMGSVLIPMGFQFLAVLGGKALILAKLALMLSSIQGLKKIATNGVNYGLYHSPEGWHERSSSHQGSPLGHFELPYQIYPSHSHP